MARQPARRHYQQGDGRRFWPDGDAFGRLVRRRDDDDPAWFVVGVASDAKVRTLGEAPRNMVYLPYS